jgi:hypothetical protein
MLSLLGCPDMNFRSAKMTNADQALPPDTPVISGPATVKLGITACFTIACTDPRGLALTFETPTPGCVIQGQTLLFTPTEPGTVMLRVVARNRAGLTSLAGEVNIKVEPASPALTPPAAPPAA